MNELAIPKEIINNLVLKAKELVTDNQGMPSSWVDLKHLSQQMELQEAVQKLEELLANEALLANPELFLEAFKQLCQERAQRNSDSCLSFTALPQGVYNQLYWDIAKCIFNPRTLGEILAIILPQGCRILTVEEKLVNSSAKKRLSDVALHFKLTELASLTKPANQTNFPPHFILADKVLFDVNCIINYDFHLHQKFYEKLSSDYPVLAKELYEHNHQLQQLLVDIQLVARKGQTAREAFNRLVREFELGGNKITGQELASNAAEAAHLHCKEYLQSLPAELKDKVLALEGKILTVGGGVYQINTSKIFASLQEGGCIEIAARDLRTILNNTANNCILDAVPALKDCEKKDIIQRYNSRSGASHLQEGGYAKTTAVPSYWLEKLLSRIEIKAAENYLDLLLFFPTKYYPTLLEHATITCFPIFPRGLEEMIARGILNPEQLAAFNQAVVKNSPKLGGIINIMFFAIKANNAGLLAEAFKTLELPLEAMKEKDSCDNTMLYYATLKPYPLQTILQLYSNKEELFTVVTQADQYGSTLLHRAATNPRSLQVILTLLPEELRFPAVIVKDYYQCTLLHWAIGCPNSLKIILNSLPEEKRHDAALMKDRNGRTILHRIAHYPTFLKAILTSLPEKYRFAVLMEENSKNGSVLSCVQTNPESMKVVLELLSPRERFAAVKKYHSLLHYIGYNPEFLKEILALLSKEDRWSVLLAKDPKDCTVLSHAAADTRSLKAIFASLSDDSAALYKEYNSLNNHYKRSKNHPHFVEKLKNGEVKKEKSKLERFSALFKSATQSEGCAYSDLAIQLFLATKNIVSEEVQSTQQCSDLGLSARW